MTVCRSWIVLSFLGLAALGAGAVAGAAPRPAQEVRAIAVARRTLASKLDPKLPRQPLDQWLRQLVGPSARIEWSVDDCGEQSGTPADKGRDFPMCVAVEAALPDGRVVSLSVQVGTFKTGVSGAPTERLLFLKRNGKYEDVRHLSDFPARLRGSTSAAAAPGLLPSISYYLHVPDFGGGTPLDQPRELLFVIRGVDDPTGLQAALTLSTPGSPDRTYSGPVRDGLFRVTVVPAPPRAAASLRLTLLDGDSEAVFTVVDRSFTVGGKPVRLSQVRRIEALGERRVVLNDGTALTGVVVGLEPLTGVVAGTRVSFDLRRATRLLVTPVESEQPRVTYRVVLRRGSAEIAANNGTLAPGKLATDTPPPPLVRSPAPIAFAAAKTYPVPAARDVLTTGDLDGDRRRDVVVAGEEELGVLWGRGDGQLAPYERIVAWKGGPSNRALADLDGDRLPEIVFLDRVSRLVILPNLGGRRFGEPRFQDVGGGNQLQVADFNGDRRPDLALGAGNGSVRILLQGEGGTFTLHASVRVLGEADGLAVGDLNGDRKQDLAVGFFTSTVDRSGVSVFYGDGTGAFRSGPSYNLGTQNMPGVAIDDFNGDSAPDLAVTHYWGGQVVVLLNRGAEAFDFQPLVRYPADSYPIQVRTADFDGDGKSDLVVPSAGKGQVSVYRNRGDGTFHDPVVVPSAGEDSRSCVVADFNRDGKPDLAVQNQRTRTVAVLLNAAGR